MEKRGREGEKRRVVILLEPSSELRQLFLTFLGERGGEKRKGGESHLCLIPLSSTLADRKTQKLAARVGDTEQRREEKRRKGKKKGPA